VSIGPNTAEVIRIQLSGTAQERDLFTSLRGFQLRSDIKVTGSPKGKLVAVKFNSWTATGHDRYDFNYNEHLTLPNPDHGSKDKDAIRPDLEKFRVYHKNAKRMVDKGLAAPFKVEVGPWKIIAQEVVKDGLIDPKKNI